MALTLTATARRASAPSPWSGGAFTVSLWIKRLSAKQRDFIALTGAAGLSTYTLKLDSTGSYIFGTAPVDYAADITGQSITFSNWNLYTATFYNVTGTSGTFKTEIFINGVGTGSPATRNVDYTSNMPTTLLIGENEPLSADGYIAHVAFFEGQLTQSQITELLTKTPDAITGATPKVYYPLLSDTTNHGSGGATYDLTLINGATLSSTDDATIPVSSSPDTAAPTLTSPTASATGATTASGSVTTNEANGTLYWIASANATESVATVKAGSSQAVTASGSQSVSITGLTASTSYYLHFVHRDAAGNDSTVASSAQFTTSAEGDTAPPTLTGPTGTATGATTATGTVSTNEANGTLYWLASANASETGTAVKAGSSQAVSAIGTQNVTVSGLTASTAYYLHYLHRDAAGNDSAVATSAQFTTSAAGDTTNPDLTGSVTFASITQTSYTAQWPAGSDNVSVTGYEYQIGSTAGAWTDAGNALSAAITGRTAGTTETVYVRAYDAAGLRSTPAISGSVTLLSVVAGINVTEPLKNNTGTVLASQSGVRVAVLQAADLVSVYEATGLTTNASGILATISNAAITTGQQYHVAIKLADGSVGITGPITAS